MEHKLYLIECTMITAFGYKKHPMIVKVCYEYDAPVINPPLPIGYFIPKSDVLISEVEKNILTALGVELWGECL